MMPTYSDEYIEYWGRVFEREDMLRRYGVLFVTFLAHPQEILEAVAQLPAEMLPLLPTQAEVMRRELAREAAEALEPAGAVLRDGRLIEPLHHCSRRHNPAPREVRHGEL